MDIYIRKEDLPNSCDECEIRSLQFPGIMSCPLTGEDVTNQQFAKIRHPKCSLKVIPKSGKLIDADDLIRRIQESGNYLSPAVLAYIQTAPAIIESEV